jgi:DNA-binding IclR family transcriptional regulator
MANWGFLTNHARVLMCIAHDPGARLRDIAASLGITERSAYGIVADLAEARYVIKEKDGRRNRHQIQAHLPLPEAANQEPAIGEILAVLAGHQREVAADRDGTSLRPPAAGVVSGERHESMTEVTRP